MRPGYQMGARERKEGLSRPDGPCPRIMMIVVPERRVCVALCMHWGLSGSLRWDGVDMKQTSNEACKEWR
jgi:hypothetical protein